MITLLRNLKQKDFTKRHPLLMDVEVQHFQMLVMTPIHLYIVQRNFWQPW